MRALQLKFEFKVRQRGPAQIFWSSSFTHNWNMCHPVMRVFIEVFEALNRAPQYIGHVHSSTNVVAGHC